MSEAVQLDCSVIVSTRNRRARVARLLDDLAAQQAPGLRFEVIVVDNGSIDGTRELVERYATRLPWIRYVYEPIVGPASGRNAGIARAKGRVLAFTDDDNRVTPRWLAELVHALDTRDDIDVVAGRIVPKWAGEVPRWLTREHWVGPLALQDYGDTPFIVDAKRPIALSTANLAIRRAVLDRIGWFSEELQRAEDTELLMRFWAAGGRCLYLPEALVAAEIQPERLTREYHRWWHNANGAWTAAFNMAESIHRDGSLQLPREDTIRLYGIPAFLMRELVGVGLRWVLAAVRRSPRALVYEYRFRFLTGYIRGRYRLHRRAHGRVRLRDIFCFLGQLAGKKLRGFIRNPELQKS